MLSGATSTPNGFGRYLRTSSSGMTRSSIWPLRAGRKGSLTAMEGSFLPAADWRVDSAARSRRPFIELPMLGLGVFALDAVLFALPGLLAASGAGILQPGT